VRVNVARTGGIRDAAREVSGYARAVRSAWLLVPSVLAMAACTKQEPPSGDPEGGDIQAADDGNAGGCATAGGTCVPYTQACPLPQQDTTLCGSTIMLCCLPPPGTTSFTPPPAEGGPVDAGGSPAADAEE
jgi:hypothetical protein